MEGWSVSELASLGCILTAYLVGLQLIVNMTLNIRRQQIRFKAQNTPKSIFGPHSLPP